MAEFVESKPFKGEVYLISVAANMQAIRLINNVY